MNIQPSNCAFINTDPPFTDVLSNIGCLLLDDAKRYGQLLDFVNIDIRLDFSVNIIVTTNNILCVQNKVIKKIISTNVKKSCSMIMNSNVQILMICDQGTGTVITLIYEFL